MLFMVGTLPSGIAPGKHRVSILRRNLSLWPLHRGVTPGYTTLYALLRTAAAHFCIQPSDAFTYTFPEIRGESM